MRCRSCHRAVAMTALVLILLAVVPVGAAAQEPPATPTATTDPEVAVLQAQLEEMRSSNDRLVDTVLWSLGGMLTVVVAVLGFIALFQIRLSDRDRDSIKRELEGSVEEFGVGLRQRVTDLLGEAKSDLAQLRIDNDQYIASKSQETTDRLNREVARLDEKIGATDVRVRETIELVETEAKESLQRDIDRLETKLVSMLEALERSIYGIRYEMSKVEADRWRASGVLPNVIRSQLEMISHARLNGYEWRIERSLDELVETLEQKPDLDTGVLADITKMLSKLPPEYEARISKINRLINDR